MENNIKTIYKVGTKEFNSKKEAEAYLNTDFKNDELRKDLVTVMDEIGDIIDFINPFFNGSRTTDQLKDKELARLDNLLHSLRENLHNFKIKRRELLGVKEYV